MTVSDLIRELQGLPWHLPVKVLMTTASQEMAEGGDITLYLDESDAVPVDSVKSVGPYVLIEGA